MSYPKSAYSKLLRTTKRDFSIDFGEGGRSRIEHTTRTHLPKDAEKACFAAGLDYSWLAKTIEQIDANRKN